MCRIKSTPHPSQTPKHLYLSRLECHAYNVIVVSSSLTRCIQTSEPTNTRTPPQPHPNPNNTRSIKTPPPTQPNPPKTLILWSYSVAVSTEDFESSNLGSNPSKTL